MPRKETQQKFKIPSEKVFAQFTCQSPVYPDVEPGAQVEGIAVTKYAGTLRLLAFMSGVAKNFQILGVTINNKVIEPELMVERITGHKVWDVAGRPVKSGGMMMILVKNITKAKRPFCFQLTMEVSEADWKKHKGT